MKRTRIAALLLALVLCLGLLPVVAMAEDDGEFTITFDAAPGAFRDGSAARTVRTTSGEDESTKHLVNIPAEQPTRDGYTFAGWYLNKPTESPSVANRNFTADATVHADWVEAGSNRMLIPFDANGGKFSDGSTKKEVPQKVGGTGFEESLPIPTREGYTFMGWYRGYQSPTNPGRKIDENETFTGPDTVTALWGKNGAAPQDPARVDFIPNGGKITSIRGIPAKDIIAGSQKAVENNIFVDGNSGIGMMMTGGDGRLDSFPEIEREGYTFDGWYAVSSSVLTNAYAGKEVDIPSGAKRADLSTVFQDGALLAAKWTQKAASPDGPFTVKFDLNYKDPRQAEIPKDKTVVKGDIVGLPDGSKLTPPASNYEFYAWCVEGTDGKLYPWKETNPVTGNMTLYAGWVKKGTVVKNGQAIDAAPVETQKPTEAEKPAETAAVSFTDVAATSPFAPAISWAVEKGITNGKTATTFGPGDPCTRAQIVTFLWRAAGSPEPKTTEAEYADVTNKDAYFYKAIQWAAEMDMEYSGTFSPGDTCTRATAVYFIWKASGSPKAGTKASFTDLPEEPEDGSQWYWPDLLDAVDWAVGQGVTNGTGDGTTFSPDNPCTRGQIVTFLYRAYAGK